MQPKFQGNHQRVLFLSYHPAWSEPPYLSTALRVVAVRRQSPLAKLVRYMGMWRDVLAPGVVCGASHQIGWRRRGRSCWISWLRSRFKLRGQIDWENFKLGVWSNDKSNDAKISKDCSVIELVMMNPMVRLNDQTEWSLTGFLRLWLAQIFHIIPGRHGSETG